jgi:hypothetical protein
MSVERGEWSVESGAGTLGDERECKGSRSLDGGVAGKATFTLRSLPRSEAEIQYLLANAILERTGAGERAQNVQNMRSIMYIVRVHCILCCKLNI